MRSRTLVIVTIYAIAGLLWIAVSDVIFLFLEKPKDLHILYTGTISGAMFLVLTGSILYHLITLHYKRLEESEKKYRSYFENNPTPMWIYDRKSLKFIAVNDAAVHNYGYSKEEFYQMTILDIRPEADAEKVKAAVSTFETEYKNSGVWTHRKKDGTIIYVQINSHLIYSAHTTHAMIMANNITQRLEAQMQLQELNTELIRQNNILRDIAWSESHNVRRPLASILGLINVVTDSKSEEEKQQCFEMIQLSAAELDSMIKNISTQINDAVHDN